ncbi:MAG: hypothetical protein H5T62_03000, partial [Anaerolineae bacterium]|nr:hypothetical protein [Anaerolineae bacterium]
TLPSPWLVGCFLGSYVLLVGPLNYVILRRRKRTAWAWVTIPVCIVLFSGCAYLTGFQIRGRQAIISQVSVIRAWAGQPVASVDSYIALFSPRRGTYQVEVDGAPLLSRLPTDVYMLRMDTNTLSVRQGDPATVRDFQVDVGEMRSFAAQSHAAVSSVRADMHLQEVPDSSSGQMRLVGTLTNEGSAPLEDCLLVLRNYVVSVGDILPGQTVSVDELLDFSATVGRPLFQQLADRLSGSVGSERQAQRRQIVQALFSYGYVESGETVLDEGLNLLGWQEGTPLPVTVSGQRPVIHATSLWLVSLPLWSEGDVVTIPPGFIFWEVVESGGAYNPTPSSFYLSSGAVTFRFRLDEEFSNLRVQELTLYLGAESLQYGGSPRLPAVYLRDWEAEKWVWQTDLAWGANPISNPASYISPEGAIEVRVSGQDYYELLMLDLSVQGRWPED